MKSEEVWAAHKLMALDERRGAGCAVTHEPLYSQEYDAFYCPTCDVWLEPICHEKGCGFCSRLPARPSA